MNNILSEHFFLTMAFVHRKALNIYFKFIFKYVSDGSKTDTHRGRRGQ